MLAGLAKKLSRLLVKNGADPALEEVYAYGIECLLSTLLILFLLIAAGLLLRKPLHMLVFIAAWLPLRMLAGGMHANTHAACTLVSVGLGIVSVLLSGVIDALPPAAPIAAAAICCALIFVFAPVVHRNHPISRKRFGIMRIAARIFAALETAAISGAFLAESPLAAPAFMGYLTTALLAAAGYFSPNTDKSYYRPA